MRSFGLAFWDNKSLEYYLSLKYPMYIYPEEEGYTVIIPDLDGCMTQGDTLEEAMNNIDEALIYDYYQR